MKVWQEMIFSLQRTWTSVGERIKSRKNYNSLHKLHKDVERCGYEDVQVMWEILWRSEAELSRLSKRKRSLWNLFI